jgi:peroxiredoxin (alkyl hydroperoxide reductase subunit C)
MAVQVQQPAPDFSAMAVVGKEFKQIKLSDYRGKYVILFFYPLDFTFVCPTEIVGFDAKVKEFERRGAQVIAVSVDSHYTHLAWKQTARKDGGLGDIGYPIVSDLTKNISRDYGVLLEGAGVALRGLFLVDKEGKLRHMVVNDLPIGRSVDEALRVLDALQFHEKHGEVCPANWHPGEATMKPDPEGSRDYFKKVAS